MGSSDESQDRNQDTSDKETQSPMLKVFKDMMKRDARWDPEKISLIYPQKEEKKRKKHSHSKSKLSEERRFDPTALDQAKSQIIYNMKDGTADKPDRKYSLPNTQCYCSTSEKESKSGASCGLQRLISVERSRLACFSVVALVSVAAACVVLYGAVPDLGRSYFGKTKADQGTDGKTVKYAELEKIKSHLDQTRSDEGMMRPASYYRNKWPSMQRSLTSNVEFSDADESEYTGRGMADSAVKDDFQNVKNFYQKFVETDALIKDLKRRINGYHSDSGSNKKTRGANVPSYRYKRSMRPLQYGSQYNDYLRASSVRRTDDEIFKDNTNDDESVEPLRHVKGNPLLSAFPKQRVRYGKDVSKKPMRFFIERQNYMVSFDNAKRDGAKLKMACNCSHVHEDVNARNEHLKEHFLDNEESLRRLLSNLPNAANLKYRQEPTGYGSRREDLSMDIPRHADRPFRLAFKSDKKKNQEPKPLNGTEDSFTLKVGNKTLVFDDKEYMKDLLIEENLNDVEEKLKAKQGKRKNKQKATVEEISAEVSTILHPKENSRQEARIPMRSNTRKLLQANEIPEVELLASPTELPVGDIYAESKTVQDLQDALQLKENLNFAASEEINRIIKNAVLRNAFIGYRETVPEGLELERLERDLSEVEKLEQDMREKIQANEMNSDPKPTKSEPESADETKTNMRRLMQVSSDASMEGKELELGSEENSNFNIIQQEIQMNTNPNPIQMKNVIYPSAPKSHELADIVQSSALEKWYASFEDTDATNADVEENASDPKDAENAGEMTSTTELTLEMPKETKSRKKRDSDSKKPVYFYLRKLLQHTTEPESYLDDPDQDVLDKEADGSNFYSNGKEENYEKADRAEENVELSEVSQGTSVEEKDSYISSEPVTETTSPTASDESPKSIGPRLRRLLETDEREKFQSSEKKAQFGEMVRREGEIKLPYGFIERKETSKPSFDPELRLGVMPSVAEEISRMISNAVLKHCFQSTHEFSPEGEQANKIAKSEEESDYVESIDDVQGQLVEVSQAYSDYGVLEEKKPDVQEQLQDVSKSLLNVPLKERQILSQTTTNSNHEDDSKESETLDKLKDLKKSELSSPKRSSEEAQESNRWQGSQTSQVNNKQVLNFFGKRGRKKKTLLKHNSAYKLEAEPEASTTTKSSFKKTLQKFIKFVPNEEPTTESAFKEFANEKTTEVSLFDTNSELGTGDNMNAFQIIDKEAIDKTTKRTSFDAPKIDIDIQLPASNRKGRSLLSVKDTMSYSNDNDNVSINNNRINMTDSTFSDGVVAVIDDIVTMFSNFLDAMFYFKYIFSNYNKHPMELTNITQTIANKNNSDNSLPKVYLIKSRSLLSIRAPYDKLREIRDTEGSVETNLTRGNSADDLFYSIQQTIDKKINFTSNGNQTSSLEDPTNPETENRTIVKRDAVADDKNIIFWKDIHDDEYGKSVPSHDSLFTDDKIEKRDNWLSKKIHSIKHPHSGQNKNKSYTNLDVIQSVRPTVTKQRIGKERSASENDNFGANGQKETLEKLSANMENVFKQAADAVNELRSPEVSVREDKDLRNDETSSMMQQLVTLMSDLVNYQVQQKTCVKLPPDLRDFLVWLTRPSPPSSKTGFITLQIRDPGNPENEAQPPERPSSSDPISRPNSEKEATEDPRSECLGTLRAVQGLLQEYDRLNDSDKNKLTEVKEYLEIQLDYLQRQLTGYRGGFTKARRLKKNETPPNRRSGETSKRRIDHDHGHDHGETAGGGRAEDRGKPERKLDDEVEDLLEDDEEYRSERSEKIGAGSQADRVYDISRRRRNTAKSIRKLNDFYGKSGRSSDDSDSKHIRKTKQVIETESESKKTARVNSNGTESKFDIEQRIVEKK